MLWVYNLNNPILSDVCIRIVQSGVNHAAQRCALYLGFAKLLLSHKHPLQQEVPRSSKSVVLDAGVRWQRGAEGTISLMSASTRRMFMPQRCRAC